jgi:hypothetical protein
MSRAILDVLLQFGYTPENAGQTLLTIKLLKSFQLAMAYQILWPNTQAQFCREYKINTGNFSRFLSGKKESQASAEAIRQFLSDTTLVFFGIKPRQADTVLGISPRRPKSFNLVQISAYLTKKAEALDHIFFIDGDNSESCVRLFKDVLSPTQFALNFHVICFLENEKRPPSLLEVAERPWFSLCFPGNKKREAVTTLMSASVTTLHMLMTPYSKIKFYLISVDNFTHELKETIKPLVRRKIYCLNPDSFEREFRSIPIQKV